MPPLAPGSLDEVLTERLVLRRPRPDDREDLRRMYADPEVMATLGGVRSASQSDETLARIIAHWDVHEFGYWTALDRETRAFVGRAGLHHVVVEGIPAVEVGYGFVSECWGRGIATEAATAIVRAAFDVLELRELVCFTMTTNARSRRVMEKVGFRYERDFVHAGLPHRLCRLAASRWRGERGVCAS